MSGYDDDIPFFGDEPGEPAPKKSGLGIAARAMAARQKPKYLDNLNNEQSDAVESTNA